MILIATQSWTYVVDQAAPGAPREQRLKGDFKTKADAIAAMNELQLTRIAATFVEPSREPRPST